MTKKVKSGSLLRITLEGFFYMQYPFERYFLRFLAWRAVYQLEKGIHYLRVKMLARLFRYIC